MPEIRVDLSDEENRKVDIFRAKNGLSSKADAIRKIINNLKV